MRPALVAGVEAVRPAWVAGAKAVRLGVCVSGQSVVAEEERGGRPPQSGSLQRCQRPHLDLCPLPGELAWGLDHHSTMQRHCSRRDIRWTAWKTVSLLACRRRIVKHRS